MGLMDRLKHALNAFRNKDPTRPVYYGPSYTARPDRVVFMRGSERTIVAALQQRIAVDVASVKIRHVQLDENGRFHEEIKGGLNNCLSVEANIDQTGRSLIQDLVMSAQDEGYVAVIPTDIDDDNSNDEDGFDVLTMRIGQILEWYPRNIRVKAYNERTGQKEEIVMPKRMVAVIENPFYAVMNEPNSIGQRLIRKFRLLDMIDEQSSSGKLDLIIQLPYVIKTPARERQAEMRRKSIERQLSEGKYGIAYTDGTERITQLNRPVENNLMKQIEYLTSMLYSQLGIHQSILDGTADEKTKLNYQTQIIEVWLNVITEEFTRKFLSESARDKFQAVAYYRDPFKSITAESLAKIADTLTRNAIVTSNEIRQMLGMKPSDDPDADRLRNKNMPVQDETTSSSTDSPVEQQEETVA